MRIKNNKLELLFLVTKLKKIFFINAGILLVALVIYILQVGANIPLRVLSFYYQKKYFENSINY